MLHVVFAGAQVGVVHLIEHPHQFVAPHLQRPLGAVAVFADQVDGGLADGRVLQHQQMGVDEFRNVGGGIAGDLFAHAAQMAGGGLQGSQETFDLVLDQLLGDLPDADLGDAVVQ